MELIEKTCCFTGHRDIPEEKKPQIRQLLRQTIRNLIQEGICFFGTGGALGFDTLAAEEVLYMRREFPNIKLIMVLPCRDQTRGWKPEEVKRYECILTAANKVVYVSEYYTLGCMHKRNRHLVDHSSVCVAYCTKSTGGSAYTLAYAKRRGRRVIELNDLQSYS